MSSEKSIAELAYRLWNARGRPDGSAEEDWLEAERRLAMPAEADRAGAAIDGVGRDVAVRNGATDPSLEDTLSASISAAGHKADSSSNANDNWHSVGVTPRSDTNPPVEETDDGPTIAPHDIGEG
jgi:hypothetical protein